MDAPSLLDYLRTLGSKGRAEFIQALSDASGHTVAYIHNVIYKHRPVSAAMAMQAHLLSKGALRLEALREDAARIWPVQMVNRLIVAPGEHRAAGSDQIVVHDGADRPIGEGSEHLVHAADNQLVNLCASCAQFEVTASPSQVSHG